MKKKPYILPYNEKRRLHYHAYRAQWNDQSEVCGIISCDKHSKIELHFLKNNSEKNGSFSVSMEAVTEARRGLNKAKRFISVFHSHVVSEAVPGTRDIHNAFSSHLQLIYDVCGHSVRIWKIRKVKGRKVAVEVPLIIASRNC